MTDNEIMDYGPKTKVSQEIHATKYRGENENFYEAMCRIAAALADNETHRKQLKEILLEQRFMPGGRIQSTVGSPKRATAINCFVSGQIGDSMESIMDRAKEAAMTMRMGGGIGYDFSRIRPKGDKIKTLDSYASGPVSFMEIYNAVCKTVRSSGHRRGAQMAILRVDHPDIEEFVRCKQNETEFTQFNISVGVTDEFMEAVKNGGLFKLRFEGQVYKEIDARALWDEIMRSTWNYAEPGVVFIDRVNKENNLWYCEKIEACNPCQEQPLPPFGACLLGSFNLTKYITEEKTFDWDKYRKDIPAIVRALDNVIEKTIYPLPQQEREEKTKRRMGIGITGLANAGEVQGMTYASESFLAWAEDILETLRNESYKSSALLGREKGSFPVFDKEKYLQGNQIKRLPKEIQELIKENGIRNSHLISIAPTGTISLSADNCSSGIEPVFSLKYQRTIQTDDGPQIETVEDYGKRVWGIEGRCADDIGAFEHLSVITRLQPYVDSSISKTANVGEAVSWEEFKHLYVKAWENGAKGLSTFRAAGKRFGILNKSEVKDVTECKNGQCEI